MFLAASLVTLISLSHAETLHAVVTVQRHGDRTVKSKPPTKLTPLGQLQCHDAGSFYRQRYLIVGPKRIDGISTSSFDAKQVYAMAPDQPLLVTSGQAFLQGLYPPVKPVGRPVKLANGQTVNDPVNGLQYTTLHSISVSDTDTIWLKADDNCPNFEIQSNEYLGSPEYVRLSGETDKFYQSLKRDYLNGVFKERDIGYQNAYNIFDYINVGSLHNETISSKLSRGELSRLRVLADRHEWAMNANVSEEHPALTISGRGLGQKIANQLETNLMSLGKENKFTLMMSSYDAFMAFFSHVGLTSVSPDFMGLPNYAASMVFELYSTSKSNAKYPPPDELNVRFLFRNGTDSNVPLQEFPIFGKDNLPWLSFQEKNCRILNQKHVRVVCDVWCGCEFLSGKY